MYTIQGDRSPLTKFSEGCVDFGGNIGRLNKATLEGIWLRFGGKCGMIEGGGLWVMGRIPQEMSVSVKKYSLGYIRPYHREIARRLVLGQNQATICRALDMTEGRMSIICNSPLFKIEIRRLEDLRDTGVGNVTEQLRELSPIALEVVERTMYDRTNKRLSFNAAESILDRAGDSRINKGTLEVTNRASTAPMTDDELRKLVMERASRIKEEMSAERRLAEKAKDIVVEFEEVDEPSNGGEVCPTNERQIKIAEIG